jgi:hypothetical protein
MRRIPRTGVRQQKRSLGVLEGAPVEAVRCKELLETRCVRLQLELDELVNAGFISDAHYV